MVTPHSRRTPTGSPTNARDVRQRRVSAFTFIHRKPRRGSAPCASCPGVSAKRLHPRLRSETPPALRHHATSRHSPIAKRFPNVAGGCDASSLPPVTATKRPRPQRGPRRTHVTFDNGVYPRSRSSIGNPAGVHAHRASHPGVSAKRLHPRLRSETPSALRHHANQRPSPIAKRFPNVAGGCDASSLPPVTATKRPGPQRGPRRTHVTFDNGADPRSRSSIGNPAGVPRRARRVRGCRRNASTPGYVRKRLRRCGITRPRVTPQSRSDSRT